MGPTVRGRLRRVAVLLAGGLLASALGARGAEPGEPSACTERNLLAGLVPTRSAYVRGDLARVTDGAVGAEGAPWASSPAVVLENGAATIEYDLGRPTELRAVYLQADANDVYGLSASLDGQDYRVLARFDPVVDVGGHGLRARAGPLPGTLARYLRIGAPVGDGAYAISELEVFCRAPSPFPPALRIESVVAPEPARFAIVPEYWNDRLSTRWQLVLAMLGIFLVGRVDRWSERACQALALLALCTYFNMGAFHFDGYLHLWDTFHYFVGGKYFREVGYERLYACVAVADRESGLGWWAERRTMTDLDRNVVVPTTRILASPELCTEHFSAERWRAFQADVAFFRDRMTRERWQDMQIDHGFNATPVWTATGSTLANLAPASRGFLLALALLDPMCLFAAAAIAGRAFGWRTTAIAWMVFATCYPSRFFWTGGAFLRSDWLLCLVASVSFLKLDRPMLAGAMLGTAALLRVFPALVLLGPAFAAGATWIETRALDRSFARIVAGFALAVIVLVPASLPIVGGPGAYRDFLRNLRKHDATPLTNNMGLPMVVSFRPSTIGRRVSDSSINPWKPWIDARRAAFREARPLYWTILTAYLGLLALAVRRRPAWMAAALAITACAFVVDLSSYYYAFVLPLAFVAHERRGVARILFACTAATQGIAWAPFGLVSTWWDEQFAAMALVMLIGFAAIVGTFVRERRREP